MNHCAVCDATTPSHKWGSIRAHDAGWYFAEDGTTYCPTHNPPWVAKWRARKNNTQKGTTNGTSQ